VGFWEYQYIDDTDTIQYKHGYVTKSASGPGGFDWVLTYAYWYPAPHYLYYVFLEQPDAEGFIRYYYLNEDFYDNGTPLDPTDDYGRLAISVRATPSPDDGGMSYGYIYYGSTDNVQRKDVFADASRLDLMMSLYYYEISQRLLAKQLVDPDGDGNLYYHYIDEPFYDNGTPLDPTDDYGRVDVQALAAVDPDGGLAYHYSYHGATDKVQYKDVYDSIDYTTDPSAPVLGTLVAKYTYDTDGTTLLEEISYSVEDSLWHKKYNFTGILGDGQIHAQRIDKYNDVLVTSYAGETEVYTYYIASGNVETKALYDNLALTKNVNYERYAYDTDGTTVLEHISYFNGLWRKEYNFVDPGDGQQHAQRVDSYNDPDVSSYVGTELYTFYASGNLHTKEVYNNIGIVKNTSYEKYTYAADGVTVTEHISYFDSLWHNESSFVDPGDGQMHAQRVDNYNDADLLSYVSTDVYTFYDSGNIHTKEIYDNAALVKTTNYEKYTYDTDGTTVLEHISYFDSDGDMVSEWHKESDFVGPLGDGQIHAQRDEVYADADLTTPIGVNIYTFYASGDVHKKDITLGGAWSETYWYYESTNLKKKLVSDGEAAIYFDTAGYKLQYYWASWGDISYWPTAGAYDTDQKAWYKNSGSVYLESYNYYPSGWVEWKNLYENTVGNNWGWVYSYHYLEGGGTFPWGTYEYGTAVRPGVAPAGWVMPDKPVRSDPDSILAPEMFEQEVGASDLDDIVFPVGVEYFYTELDDLKASSTGEGVTIALLDTGIDKDLLDIDIIGGYDFAGIDVFDGFYDEDYTDVLGHGTVTTSVIKGAGGTGVAPDADILAVKVFDDEGETTSSVVAEAIRYAVDSGAKILTMPFSLFPIDAQVESALDYALGKDVIVIASAGNYGTEIMDGSLAAYDDIITVGSVDDYGKLTAWSNYGSQLDLYAPWDVVTLEGADEDEAGTSFSAAFVAGITALMLSENPGMTEEEVLAQLKAITAGLGEEKGTDKKQEVKGADIDEVVSKYEAIRKNKTGFNGYSIKEDEVNLKKAGY